MVRKGEVHEARDGTGDRDLFPGPEQRIIISRGEVEAERGGILEEHLGRQEAKHVAGRLFREPKVHGVTLLLRFPAAGDAPLAGVVARSDRHPVPEFPIGFVEVLTGRNRLFLNMIAFVHLSAYLERIGLGGGFHELPETDRTGL